MVPLRVSEGASLTGVTTSRALRVASLQLWVPAKSSDTSRVVPAAPSVRSQARYQSLTGPLKFKAGTNRTRVSASAARSRALDGETAGMSCQTPFELKRNCQVPWLFE